jgi:hypothetical protein
MRASERTLAPCVLAALCLLVACGEDEGERDPLPDWRDGYDYSGPDFDGDEGQDGGVPAPDDTFAIAVPDSVTHPMRIHRAGSEDAPCAIEQREQVEELECVMEINELDLLVLGVQYETIAPEGMCDFVIHGAPLFQTYEIGIGPSEVAYTKHPDESFTDEVNSELGKPQCPYDYGDEGGPNCCLGTYTLSVTSAETGETATGTRSWGGDPGSCLDGAGYWCGDPLSDGNIPLDLIVYTDRSEYREVRDCEGISDVYGSTVVPYANYYDPDDHGGGPPAAFTGTLAREDYIFECVDDADEIIARIRLKIREWNEEAEFDDRGDPDSVGTEPVWETPIDDYLDFGALTPGPDTYPGYRRPTR